MKCYREGGCGPYENRPCSQCPASRPEYAERGKLLDIASNHQVTNPLRPNGFGCFEPSLASKKQVKSNKPLTLEQLRQMDGEPVWIVLLSPTDTCPDHWRIWQTHEYQPCELEAYGKVWSDKPEEVAE